MFWKKKDITVLIRFKAVDEQKDTFLVEIAQIKDLLAKWYPKHVTVQVEQKPSSYDGMITKDTSSSFDILVDNVLVLTNTWIHEGMFTTSSESKQAFVRKAMEDAMSGKVPNVEQFKKDVKAGKTHLEKVAMDEANTNSVELKRLRLEKEEVRKADYAQKLAVIKQKISIKETTEEAQPQEPTKPKTKAASKAKSKSKSRTSAREKAKVVDASEEPKNAAAAMKAKDVDTKDADADAAAGPPARVTFAPALDQLVPLGCTQDLLDTLEEETHAQVPQQADDGDHLAKGSTGGADAKAQDFGWSDGHDLQRQISPYQDPAGLSGSPTGRSQDVVQGLSMLLGFTSCCRSSSDAFQRQVSNECAKIIDEDFLRM